MFSRSPLVIEVLTESIHPTIKGPRGGKQYTCAECKQTFANKDVQVDHTNPVVRINETIHDLDYNMIVERIFCKKSNLKVLCKPCHKLKTAEERKQRKQWKLDNLT